jgi:hypothetical protein
MCQPFGISTVLFALGLAAMGPPTRLPAQVVRVYVHHSKGVDDLSDRVFYTPSGAPIRDTVAAALSVPFSVPSGGKICIVVEDGNPLLFSYSVTSAIVPYTAPAGLIDLAAQLQARFPGGPKAVETKGLAVEPEVGFRTLVLGLALHHIKALENLRLHSDEFDHFSRVADSAKVLYSMAKADNDQADVAWAAIKDTSNEALKSLRVQQAVYWQQIVSLNGSFIAATAVDGKDLCTKIDHDHVKVTLKITQLVTGDEAKYLARKVPKSDLAFDIDPESTAQFEVGAGTLITSFVSKGHSFAVENGVVVDRPYGTAWRLGAFAMARWRASPLWGAIGVAKSDTNQPDYFFGSVARLGNILTGPSLSIGAGIVYTNAPVGLKGGAVVGNQLPSKIDKIEDAVVRQYQPGLGVTITVTGLKTQIK